MYCLECQTPSIQGAEVCQVCGSQLVNSSRDLVATHSNLPAVLQKPHLPRIAAGVGALAFGVGLELARRTLAAKLAKPALHSAANMLLPQGIGGLGETLLPQRAKSLKLPKGYEIEETAIYINRVIRRKG